MEWTQICCGIGPDEDINVLEKQFVWTCMLQGLDLFLLLKKEEERFESSSNLITFRIQSLDLSQSFCTHQWLFMVKKWSELKEGMLLKDHRLKVFDKLFLQWSWCEFLWLLLLPPLVFLCSPGVVLACKVRIVQTIKYVSLASFFGWEVGSLLDLSFMMDTALTSSSYPNKTKEGMLGRCLPCFKFLSFLERRKVDREWQNPQQKMIFYFCSRRRRK